MKLIWLWQDLEPLLWKDHLFPPKRWKYKDTKQHKEMLSFLMQKQALSLIHFVTLSSSKLHLKYDYWLLVGPTI